MDATRPPRPLLVVTDAASELPRGLPACGVDDYLDGGCEGALDDGAVVVNLAPSYRYMSKGYYVSLLAEARGQQPLPPVASMEEAGNPFASLRALREQGAATSDPPPPRRDVTIPGGRRVVAGRERPVRLLLLPDAREAGGATVLEADAHGRARPTPRPAHVVTAVLGRTLDPRFRRQAAAAFRALRFPLMRLGLVEDDGRPVIASVQPLVLRDVQPAERELLGRLLARGASGVRAPAIATGPVRRLAVLWEADDPYAPSDLGALESLRRAAAGEGLLADRIGKRDIGRLAEFDALFIRTNTAVGNGAFAFAQAAEALALPVIDAPQAIIRCSNKVFLHELFRRHGLPEPASLVLSRGTPREEIEELGWPIVLKIPDGTFSDAVEKADTPEELERLTAAMLRRSPLLIAQEFVASGFDWRVGVLDGVPLWACRYHMAPGHWQVVARDGGGSRRYGRVEAVPVAAAPPEVLGVAVAAATLLGPGLFGVDLKERDGGVVIIEVNDCPNLERGEEDAADGESIYRAIASAFARRVREAAERAAAP